MKLIQQIEQYQPANEQEKQDKTFILHCLKYQENIFSRDNPLVHMTASAWVVNEARTKVLMVYHNIYNSWSWMGGHADGEEDLLAVALREVREESGICQVHPVTEDIYSLEVLTVDGHVKHGKYVSSHLHLNVTYLLEASEEESLHIKPDENSGVAWFDLKEAVQASSEPWFQKWIYPKLKDKVMKKKWWHDKVAYQIYPKSFKDGNGDGIGDLRGIIEKLDYLKELGVGIVWISPIYKSPFVDQGYDISDYYAIDPVFGTMEDMDKLLAEAKKRDIAIIMDLVVNHCSDQHAWFQKALKEPFGKYGKYFYIKEGKNGNPPCNWRSYFGGSVWEKLPGYDNLFYLHMFAKEQPDLNWENPELRQEIYKMIRWWLEKGMAGFRLDAIINIKKDLRFQDFPADREDGMCSGTEMLKYAEGVHEFLQEMKREAFEPYQAFTIGELFDFRPEEMERYIGDDGCFESIFDFAPHILGGSEKGWYDCRKISPDEFRNAIYESKRLSQNIGMMANIIENHDEPRGVSRYLPEGEVNEMSKKMLAGISLMTFGLPFLYQGQEIGMTNKTFRNINEVDDICTIDEYYVALENGLDEAEALKVVAGMSQDNARTPMQWSGDAYAGFSTTEPWLKVNENYQEIHVEEQQNRADSVLNFYKKLIALRKDSEYGETVVYGKQVPAFEDLTDFMGFYRKGPEKTLLVLANYQMEPREVFVPEKVKKILIDNYSDRTNVRGNSEFGDISQPAESEYGSHIQMKGYQFLVMEI